MGCGCGSNSEATALAGFGAVVGRRAGRVRTRQLQKAASGGRAGVNTAARVAGAFFRAKRGIVLRDKGQRRAYDRRVVGLVSAYRAQLKRVRDPLSRMAAAAQYVVQGLGGTASEAAAAAAYVVGRATGKITASPRAYLRGQSSGSFTAGAGGVVGAGGVGGSSGGGLMRPRLAAAFRPGGARPPAFPGFPAFPGVPTLGPSPAARVLPAFQLPVRRSGSYAAQDEVPEGTAASSPLRPQLPGLRPRAGLALIRPAGEDDGEDDRPAIAVGDRDLIERADSLQRYVSRGGRAMDLEPSFRPPGGGGDDGDDSAGRMLSANLSRFPGAGRIGSAPSFRNGGGEGLDAEALDDDALDAEAAGFGVVNVWDRWRTQGNMQRKIERLRAEIEQLRAAYAEAGSSGRKAKIRSMIEYRERRIEGFERGLQDKAARRKDQRAWLVQQTARFSGVDAFGAAPPIGLSSFDQFKPYVLPLTGAALFGYLMVQSWRGGSRPAASPQRRTRGK